MSEAFLKGYRALDLTGWGGQLCGRILADLGMEVIKIEPPGGDPVRELPPIIKSADGKTLSATFAHLNAGKASKVLDLNDEAGREMFRRLVPTADVVLESFSPGDLEQKGLGYQRLAEINPGVVMASITGFGQTGPKKNLACNDLIALAQSGFLYISGDPSLPPCKPPETQAFYFASIFAAAGVLAALYRRERTGRGDHIDMSMQEGLATHAHIVRLFANEGKFSCARGQHGTVAPAEFSCRDGCVYLYVTRQHWKLFLEIWQEHPPEMDGPEWLNNLYRRAHADEINAAVEASRRTRKACSSKGFLASRSTHRCNSRTTNRSKAAASGQWSGRFRRQQRFSFRDRRRTARARSVPLLDSWREGGGRQPFSAPQKTVAPGNGPLDGMRIVSFDHVLAGPYGTTILADLGADVIKIESRKGGMDPFRFFGTGEIPICRRAFWNSTATSAPSR
jgi:crotonobetainyl-CoA:carnitine CoA-transferase CaiB-like acyl-CoA transferase